MRSASRLLPRIAAGLLVAVSLDAVPAAAAPYVWPLSGTTTQDLMNTSFGPREDYAIWDFHDGIDLPAALGTTCYAVADGTVFRADVAGTDQYSSRHVILRVVDPSGTVLFVNYLHLSAIQPGIVPGATVVQGAIVGYVGHDDATYDHLHFEIRHNTNWQYDSIHPLDVMPYADTVNFTFTVEGLNRFDTTGGLRSARILFGAGTKEEGDLRRVAVDLLNGASVLGTRTVHLDDKATVFEGNGDENLFTNDIGLEGYQTSNMVLEGRPDIREGVLVRNLPANCDGLRVTVTDIAGHAVTGGPFAVPSQTAFDESVSAESGVVPPAGWTAVTSASGTGTTVFADPAAAHDGGWGITCLDASTTEGSLQSAAVEIPLPAARYEWTAEAWINPVSLGLASTQAVYLLEFVNGAGLSTAAYVRKVSGNLVAGIAVENPGPVLNGLDNAFIVPTGAWHHWRLEVRRNGTRETTSVLSIDGAVVQRFEWSSTAFEPTGLRAGIGLISPGATATVRVDGIRVTEEHMPPFPPLTTPPPAVTATPTGSVLADIVVEPTVITPAMLGCVEVTRVPPGVTAAVYTASGRLVKRLDDGALSAGHVTWCLRAAHGPVARGVYLLVFLDAHGHRRIVKIVAAQ